MAGLIAVSDLDARGITYTDSAQAQAAIDDASAAARLYVAPVLDSVDTPDAPDGVVAVVCAMVRRGLTNPQGLNMEVLGDYSYQSMGGVATLYPTARERKMLRAAAAAYATANNIDIPAWGAASVFQQADLPVDYEATELL